MKRCFKRILTGSLTFAIFFSCQVADGQSSPEEWKSPEFSDTIANPLNSTPDHLKQGEKLYFNACSSCHGYGGKGNGPAAETLNPKPADHTSEKVQSQTDGAIFYKISTGKGKMQPYYSTLSVKQRWQLVLYIRSLSKYSREPE